MKLSFSEVLWAIRINPKDVFGLRDCVSIHLLSLCLSVILKFSSCTHFDNVCSVVQAKKYL